MSADAFEASGASADPIAPGASRSSSTPERARQPRWLRLTLAVLFGLFFAYDLWEVVESLVQLLSVGIGFTAVGWVIMVLALLAPVGLFVAAFAFARRRGFLVSILGYLAGLAVSAAVFLTLSALLQVADSFA